MRGIKMKTTKDRFLKTGLDKLKIADISAEMAEI